MIAHKSHQEPLKIIVSIFLLVYFLFPGQVSGQKQGIKGEVSGTWYKKNSPYQVEGDIILLTGKKLDIEAGTIVEFKGPYKFTINGQLSAIGKEADTIVFTCSDTTGFDKNPNKGWCGLRFEKPQIISGKALNDDLKSTKPKSQGLKRDSSKIAYCKFEFATVYNYKEPYCFGGAVYINQYNELSITHSKFTKNRAVTGGALYCKDASPVVANTVFYRNRSMSSGGAISLSGSNMVFRNNQVIENCSSHNGGGFYADESNPSIVNNVFLLNKAIQKGGGIYSRKYIKHILHEYQAEEELEPNKKSPAGDTLSEMNIPVVYTHPEDDPVLELQKYTMRMKSPRKYGKISGNVICNNTATSGAGIGLEGDSPDIINNTISFNISGEKAGGLECLGSNPIVVNTILWNNKNPQKNSQVFFDLNSSPEFIYCNIEDGYNTLLKGEKTRGNPKYTHNITVVPKYLDIGKYDYRLDETSGCIDAGMADTTNLFLAAFDIKGARRVQNKIDIGAYENNTRGNLPVADNQKPGTEQESLKDKLYQVVGNIVPNPSVGRFRLNLINNPCNSLLVNIKNVSGQVIYNANFKNTTNYFYTDIDLTNFNKGVYVLEVIGDGKEQLYNEKLIIE